MPTLQSCFEAGFSSDARLLQAAAAAAKYLCAGRLVERNVAAAKRQ